MAAHGVGRLHLVDDLMRKERYLSVLDNEMFPSAIVLFPNLEYIYQEDNDPKHTVRVVKQWYREVLTVWIGRLRVRTSAPFKSILEHCLKDRAPSTKAEIQQGWRLLESDLLTR